MVDEALFGDLVFCFDGTALKVHYFLVEFVDVIVEGGTEVDETFVFLAAEVAEQVVLHALSFRHLLITRLFIVHNHLYILREYTHHHHMLKSEE